MTWPMRRKDIDNAAREKDEQRRVKPGGDENGALRLALAWLQKKHQPCILFWAWLRVYG